MLEHKPDRLVINGSTVVHGMLYPERGDVAFYDTDRTVQGPNTLMVDNADVRKFSVSDEVLHTHNNNVALDPPIRYFVSSLPRNYQAGGPVEEVDCGTILLSENRP
jgi:hypothetical protein